ncbi:MAG: PaaI family thioesterase [Pseudomonadota bacterium]
MAAMESNPGEVPKGFSIASLRGPFTRHNGPVYRADDDDDLRSGLFVLERHCNGMGFLHGGMIAAFSDSALAWAVWWKTQRRSVTLKLTLTYLDTVKVGTWLEARPTVTAEKDDCVHLYADLIGRYGAKVARADAVFRLLRRNRV